MRINNLIGKNRGRTAMLSRFIIGLFAAAALVLAATGCNTVRGAGEDVESVGSTVAGD